MSLRYAVFGHPVAHSRSPGIHAAFAAQCGIDLAYARIDAAPQDFERALARFADEGGRGANVTLPHKPAALALCDEVAPRAARAGAANTLVRLDDAADGRARWRGDNTDGTGLLRDLRDRHGLALENADVLLLGAGGAAAGVAPALLDAGVARLWLANRGLQRAQALAARLGDARVVPVALQAGHAGSPHRRASIDGNADAGRHARGPDAAAAEAGTCASTIAAGTVPLDALTDTRIHLVVNATSAARDAAAPWAALHALLPRIDAAVDLGYGEAAQAFLGFARDRGVPRRIDGLGMLVEQAAESFRLWHGVAPDTAPVLAGLRDELGAPP